MSNIYDDNPLRLELGTEIRVLELLYNYEDEPKDDFEVACRLHTITLGDGTPFVAISYVWGSASETRDILLDGGAFAVRTNLYRLLQKMVRKKFSSYFWVDAVCVDQRNVRERNQQVALMEQIYPKASSVIVWLNPQNTSVDNAMVLLAGMYKKGIGPNDYDQVKEALQEICYLEYWSRAWIVQEYTLAENIELWGTDCSISGDVLSYAAYDYIWWLKQFKENYDSTTTFGRRFHIPWSSPAGKIISCRKQWRFSRAERQRIQSQSPRFLRPEGLPFDYVFSIIGQEGRQLQCTDVRDRVYAMLSLLREEDALKAAIRPDYSRSVSQLFFDICTKVCKELSEVERFRALLEFSDHRIIRFIYSNWPLRMQDNTYGSSQLDMCVALLLPHDRSSTIIPRTVSAPDGLIPRHLAARVNLYATVPLQRGVHANFRLLRVLPNGSQEAALIECSLRTVPSVEFVEFSALSCAWEGEAPRKPILVNGYTLNVHENVWSFLNQARSSHYSTEIWIDAVCVDQEDLLDKTHHAKMIGQIYSHAYKIIAWMSPDLGQNLRSSLKLVAKAHAMIRCPARSLFGRHNWPMAQDTTTEESLGFAHGVLDALHSVLSDPYWRRTWTAQEYILARKVELWVGELSLDDHVLSRMCEATTTWPDKLPGNLAAVDFETEVRSLKSKSRRLRTCWAMNIIMQRDFRQGYSEIPRRWRLVKTPQIKLWYSFQHLLTLLAGSDCVDSRDHVYALLPLMTREELQYFDIVPDYSLPGSQLFINLACAFCLLLGFAEGWATVQHLAGPLCSEGHVDLDRMYGLLYRMMKNGDRGKWQRLASRVIYEMSGKQACFEPHIRDGG